MARFVHIDELEKIAGAGVNWRPIRRTLGITAFGINAYTADAGEQLIEDHDETGGHEELYVVIAGRAVFTIDGEQCEASAGTLVYLDDPGQRRSARAAEDGTTAIAVGGEPGTITPSAWEHYFAATPLANAGDPAGAYEVASGALADHPDHPALNYVLACYSSLAGERVRALNHLRKAIEVDPNVRDWARTEADLDAIRSDPEFPS